MYRRLVPYFGTCVVALGAFLVVAAPATAQQQGHRGGSSFGNSQWSGGRSGFNTGYYSPYYGGNYGPRYYTGGYNSYYPQYYGSQNRTGAYEYDSNSYSNAPSSYYRADDGRESMYAPVDENTVRITVRVSPSAEIWIDGTKTTQTGGVRQFISPPIDSDRECTYEIRAKWTEGGQEVDRTRKVNFHAGDQLTVNFMKRGSQGAAVNGKREDLTRTSPANEESEQPTTLVQDLRRPPTTPTANAADKSTHDGKVVSIAEDKLVMTGKDDQEHSHALTADVKLSCDGSICNCKDIKAGMRIRVTTKKDDKQTVTRIEALDKNVDFQNRD